MELVAGYPYWLIKSGLPFQYPKLLENKKCHVAIIGGGISGALTAYFCLQAGIECILIDGRAIGLGSTCASTSLLQYELDIPLHQLKKLVGEYNANRSFQLCGEAVEKLIDLMDHLGFTEYSKRQSLFFSRHRRQKEFLKKEFLARAQARFDVQLLMKEELKSQYGLNAFGGILSEKGAAGNIYLLTHKILQYCIQKGLRVFERTHIKQIEERSENVILKTAEGHQVIADYMVNATGYEAIHYINKKIVDIDCTYAIISEPLEETNESWKDPIMMWNTDDPYLYLRTTDDNRIIVGGRDEPFANMKTMHAYLHKKTARLERDFKKCFPRLPFKTEFAWSGVFGRSKDSLPYIGNQPGSPRIFYALGFGGNGITFSLIAAEITRDLLLGKKNKDAPLFTFSR